MADRLRELVENAEHLDRKRAVLKRRLDKLDEESSRAWYAVHEQMSDEGYQPGEDRRLGDTRYGYQVDWYASVQDGLEFEAWAEEHAPHLIRPKPNMAALNQLVVAAQEDGRELNIPGIGMWPKRWISKRQASAK